MPINILIHPGTIIKVLLYFSLVQCNNFKGLSSTQILQGLFVKLFWKAALPHATAACCLPRDQASSHSPFAPEKGFFTELLPASLYTSNYIYCYTYFFSFCGFYPKSLQLMEKSSMASKGFHLFIFLFCQEMLMFKGIMVPVLCSFIKTTEAEVVQRHKVFKALKKLEKFAWLYIKNRHF